MGKRGVADGGSARESAEVGALVRGGLAVLFGCLFVAGLSLPHLPGSVALILSDTGQLAAAAVAAAMCCRAASRRHGRERLGWAFLAAGTGSWAAGQLVWTYYEAVLGVEVPFPSLADVGFLLFPLFAVPGLLSGSGVRVRAAARGRDLLDGAIIAASLLVLSWSTALGSVVAGSGGGWLAVTLSLAYPLADVVLATVVLLMLGSTVARTRATLLLVASGVACLSVADSAYVYLVAIGSYSSGDLVTSGWVFGFLFIAAGATMPTRGTSTGAEPSFVREGLAAQTTSRLRMLLPYIPLLAAGATICFRLATASVTPLFDLSLGVVLVTLVLSRQFLAMSENFTLMGVLEVTRDQLQHQALHDPLTGLANRALFADRFDHALTQRGVDVSLLYCDLDDFKRVNDELGHHTGDALLRLVAQRLLDCVRSADTVARLGGDEFAVLLEDSSGVSQVAERIVAAIHEPYLLGETTVSTSVSVGVAHHQTGGGTAARNHLRVLAVGQTASAEQLLNQADSAMYVAKASGKGRVVLADGGILPNSPNVSVPAAGQPTP